MNAPFHNHPLNKAAAKAQEKAKLQPLESLMPVLSLAMNLLPDDPQHQDDRILLADFGRDKVMPRRALEILVEADLTPSDLISQPPEKLAELIAHALRMSVTPASE